MVPFFCIHISQGSVATCLKRGGIFKHEFVANLLPSRLVKNFFENRIIVSEVMAKSLVSCFFDSRCMRLQIYCAKLASLETSVFSQHYTLVVVHAAVGLEVILHACWWNLSYSD